MIRNFIFAFWLLFLSTQAFAIHPYKDYVALPSQAGMSYDSLNIPTTDHFRLTGWYCKPAKDSSDILIVLAGGDAGNMSYDLQLAQFLIVNFHVPVMLFDYRGFGTSQAFAYDSNAVGHPEYLTDFDAAVSYAKSKYVAKNIIIYGRSLGASLALVEGSMENGISGVIAESPYAYQDSIAHRFEAINPSRSVKPITSDKLEPWKHIRDFRAKNLLILHGASEKYIFSGELQELLQAAPGSNKKFIDFAGCDHLELPFKGPQQFGDAMAVFLTQCEK
jgi:alpha-beta hydrolase superfamily lysophospholipase